MKSFWGWLMAWRVITVMPFLIVGWVFGWGGVASWLNHGKPLIDDPSAIYGSAMACVRPFFCIMLTRLYSGMLNNSLTPEQYSSCAWQDRLVDNAPEVIVFGLCVYAICIHGA
jgi:hypothetical protein